MLLGAGSLVLALVEPQRSGVQTGFIASSIGITAIVVGSRLVKDRYRNGAVARAFGRGGAILGTVGTALMAYAVLGVGLSVVGVHLPALSLPIESRGSVLGGVTAIDMSAVDADRTAPTAAPTAPAAPAVPVAEPVPAAEPDPETGGPPNGTAPTSFEAEQSALVQSAGTLAFVLRQEFVSGSFPETLSVVRGESTRVVLPDGRAAASLPDGARVLYSVSADRSAWSVTVVGSRFGAIATYSSAVGMVQGG